MRRVERLRGTGAVVTNSGERQSVEYYLEVWQEDVPAGTMGNPHATIPGLKEVIGAVQPYCFRGNDDLTLELQDGKKIKFFFKDESGTVVCQSWLG